MILIKNEKEWLDWKEQNHSESFCYPLQETEPTEYPCYILLQVSDWGMQEEEYIFYYKEDIGNLLNNLL